MIVGNIWIRRNGGNWNNNPSAVPAPDGTGVGGIAIPPFLSGLVYVSMMGDVTNVFSNLGASPFTYSVPTGFTSGWPNTSNTGFTTMDPTKTYGDCSLLDGNLTGVFNPSIGQALSVDGYAHGAFYFEWQVGGIDIFTHTFGMGISVISGGLPDSDWTNGAGQGWQSIWSFGSEFTNIFPSVSDDDVFSVAVAFTSLSIEGVQATTSVGNVTINQIQDSTFQMGYLESNEIVVPNNQRAVVLRISKDAGGSWSEGIEMTSGPQGATNTVVQALKFGGVSRNQILEVRIDGPYKSSLHGIFIQTITLNN